MNADWTKLGWLIVVLILLGSGYMILTKGI